MYVMYFNPMKFNVKDQSRIVNGKEGIYKLRDTGYLNKFIE